MLSDPPQMGEAKTFGIFQAIAQRAVDADMGEPDHGQRQHQRLGGGKSARHQRHRREVAVRGVVDDRPLFGAGEIGRKAEVWRQEQQDVDPPRSIPDTVKQRHADKQR